MNQKLHYRACYRSMVKEMNQNIFTLCQICLACLVILACDPPATKPLSNDQGLAGETIGGEMIGGEMTGGEMTGGEMTGGEMTGGEMTGGEMIGGEMTGGEMIGGEMIGGEEPPPSLCDRYCALFTSECQDQSSARWGQDQDSQTIGCLSDCDTQEEGEEGVNSGETVACSLSYLSLALEGESRACIAGDLFEDRPCFDYDANLNETGDFSRSLAFGEVSRVRLTLNEDQLIKLIATDGQFCLVNDFRFIIYELTDPINPQIVARVDDYSVEGLDYCPVWLGELSAGIYEIEIGTYQDEGADQPFVLSISQPEALMIGAECIDAALRPISICVENSLCEEGQCRGLRGLGEQCTLNQVGEPVELCDEGLFCYVTSIELAEQSGACTPDPQMHGAPCSPLLAHCLEDQSCIPFAEGWRCETAQCGDGVLNSGEDCDDGNLEDQDGCSALCLVELRAEIAEPRGSVQLIGELNAESHLWARPSEQCLEQDPQSHEYPYETRVVSNHTGEGQTITIRASWSDFDGFLHVYRGDIEAGEINLQSPLTECILGNDDGISGTSESVLYSIEIPNDASLTLVSSSYECCLVDADRARNYRLIVSTDGCGDGYLQEGEQCDDGNQVDGDRCSAACLTERYCGDGIISGDEVCDDGNDFNGDGCSSLCDIEPLIGQPLELAIPGQQINPHGAIVFGAPLWERPGTFADPCAEITPEFYAFEYFTLNNNTGFDQIIDIDLIPEGEFEDFYLHVFQDPFQPQADPSECLTGADGGGERFVDDRLEGFTIRAGDSVALIISGYDPAEPPFGYPGSYQLSIHTREPQKVDACDLISPNEVNLVEGEDFEAVMRVTAVEHTTLSSANDLPLIVDFGFGPVGTSPDERLVDLEQRLWRWYAASGQENWNDEGGDWAGYDEYRAHLLTPSVGEWRLAARASFEGQGWRYCDLGPSEGFQLDELGQVNAIGSSPPRLLINEIDYDQLGGDISEFIELYNPGPSRFDLTGVRLSFYDGNTNTEYLSMDLSTGGILSAGDYFVIGSTMVTDLLPATVGSMLLPAQIQNGGQQADGLRLERDGVTIDALSYEGEGASIDGYTEGEGVVEGDDPALQLNGSLSRCPNGEDRDQNRTDFTVSAQNTPGAENECP